MLNRRNVTVDVKHYEDCEQLFMSVGYSYLVEALLEFFKMEDVNKCPKENNSFLLNDGSDEEKKDQALAVLDTFVMQYLYPSSDEDTDSMESSDDDSTDGIFNYAQNLLKSFMILLDCKDAVASGNGEHLAVVQKQMLFHFSSISGFNSYAIEMLISTVQNEVLLSPREAHQCKWAALANWKGGKDKNIEIDLHQENRNADLKGLIRLMGANKTEKAIGRMSRAVGGVRKVVDVFEEQAVIKPKSSAHSHRSSAQDEDKVLHDLHKLKPFSPIIGRSHKSFVGISSDPLENLNEQLFCEWLKRHQKNIALHFPTVDEVPAVQPSDDGNEQSDNVDNLISSLVLDDLAHQ